MKRTEAMKSILIEWTVHYIETGDVHCLYGWQKWGYPETMKKVFITWFGSIPFKENLDVFIDTYLYWMYSISTNINQILSGETTIEKVIFERVIEETWL
jgi:hypothetical protein